jgi:hypothetical protein
MRRARARKGLPSGASHSRIAARCLAPAGAHGPLCHAAKTSAKRRGVAVSAWPTRKYFWKCFPRVSTGDEEVALEEWLSFMQFASYHKWQKPVCLLFADLLSIRLTDRYAVAVSIRRWSEHRTFCPVRLSKRRTDPLFFVKIFHV